MPSPAAKTLLLLSETWPPAGVESYWLYMDFVNAHAAPLTSPHTAALDGSSRSEGAIVLDQTGANFSATANQLVIPANTGAWGDMGYWDATGRTRAAGVALLQRFTVGTWEEYGFGWGTNVGDDDPDNFEHAIQLNTTDGVIEDENGMTLITGLSTATEYAAAIILRATGAFYYLYNGSIWQLIGINDTGATATLYPVAANLDAVLTVERLSGANLNTDLPTVYPVPLISDAFSDDSAPYLTDGAAHNEGKREGQAATATVSGALDADTLAGIYHNVPLNDTSAGGRFNGDSGYTNIPGLALEANGWNEDTVVFGAEFSFDDLEPSSAQVIAILGADLNNAVYLQKSTTSGRIDVRYVAGGTSEQFVITGLSANTKYHIALWAASGSVRCYMDGTEQGSALSIDGSWVGTIIDAVSAVGVSNTGTQASAFDGEVYSVYTSINQTSTDAKLQALTAASPTAAALDTNIGSGKYVLYNLDDAPVGASLGKDKQLLSGSWSTESGVIYNGPVPGADEIVNGVFAADTDWDKGTGWTIASDVASKAAGTASILEQTVDPLTTLTFYEVTYTVANRTAGTVYARCGSSGGGVARSTNDTFTETIFSDGVAFAMVADAAFDGDVSAVSAKPLTFADLTTKSSDEITYPYARANVSIDDGYQSGVIVRDQVVRVNRDDAGDDSITVFDVDTMTASSLTGITYSDGATLEAAYREDGKIWVHYNGEYVTADTVTVDAASLQSGLFGTGSPSGESEAFECWQVDQCTGLEAVI